MDIVSFTDGFAAAIESEGGSVVRNVNGGIDAVRTATGATIGWRPPDSIRVDDRALHVACAAARCLSNLGAQIEAVRRDPDLSDSAKQRKVEGIAAEARARAEGIAAEAKSAIDAVARAEASMEPPRAADAIEATEDGEVRAYVRGMDAADQARLAQRMLSGQADRELLALSRSPLPLAGVLAEALPQAWQRFNERQNPDRSRALARGRALSEWLGVVVDQMQGALPTLDLSFSQQRDAELTRRKAG